MSVGQGIATRYAEIGRLEVTKNGEFKRSRIDTGDVVLYDLDQFHFVMNVAVGAANGPFHDSATNRGGVESYKTPWRDGLTQIEAMNDFYK